MLLLSLTVTMLGQLQPPSRTWSQLHRRTPPTKQLQPPLDLVTVAQEDSINQTATASTGLGHSCTGGLHQPNSYSLHWTWSQLHRRTPPTKQLQPPLDLIIATQEDSTNQTATASTGLGHSCTGGLHQPNSYSLHWTWSQLHRRTPPTKQLQPPLDLVTVAQEDSTNQTATASTGLGHSCTGGLHQPNSYSLHWTWSQLHRRTPPTKQLQPPLDLVTAAQEDSTNQTATASTGLGHSCTGGLHQPNSYSLHWTWSQLHGGLHQPNSCSLHWTWSQLHRRTPPTKQLQPPLDLVTAAQEDSTNQTAAASTGLGHSCTGGLHQPNSYSLHWTWSQWHRRTPPTKQLQPPLDLVTATQEDSTNQTAAASIGRGHSCTGGLHQPNSYSLHWTWSQLHRRTPPTKQLQPPLDLVTAAQEDSTNQTATASTGLGHSYTGGLHQPNSYSLHWTWSQLHRRTPPTKQLQPPLDLVIATQEDSTNQTATASIGLGHSYTGGLHQPNSYSLHWTWSQLHRRTPPTKQLQPPLDLVTVAQEDSTNQTAAVSIGLGHSCTGGLHQPNSYSLHWTWSQLHRRTPPTKQLQPPLDLVTAAQEDSTNQTATASTGLGHSYTGGLHQPNSYSLHWTWSQLHRRTPPTKQLQPPLDLVTVAQEDSTNQTATASTGLGHSYTGGLHQPNSYSLHWTWSQLHRRTPPTKQLQSPLDLVTATQEDSTNQTATASTGLGHSYTGGLHQPNSCSLHWTWSQLHRRTPPTKQLQPPLDLVTAAQEDSTNQTATASTGLGHSYTGGLHQPNSYSLHWTWSQLHRRTPPTKQLQPPLDLVTATQEDSTNQTATASTGLGHSCTGGLHQPNSYSLHWTWSQLHRRTPPTKQLQPPLDLVTATQEDSTNQTATASTGLGHSCTGGLHQPNSYSLHWTWSQLHRRTPPTKQLQPPLDLVIATQEDSINQTATASTGLGHSYTGGLHQPNSCSLHWTWSQLHRRTPPTKQLQPPLDLVTAAQEDSTNQTATASTGLGHSYTGGLHQPNSYSLHWTWSQLHRRTPPTKQLQPPLDLVTATQEDSTNQTATASTGLGHSYTGGLHQPNSCSLHWTWSQLHRRTPSTKQLQSPLDLVTATQEDSTNQTATASTGLGHSCTGGLHQPNSYSLHWTWSQLHRRTPPTKQLQPPLDLVTAAQKDSTNQTATASTGLGHSCTGGLHQPNSYSLHWTWSQLHRRTPPTKQLQHPLDLVTATQEDSTNQTAAASTGLGHSCTGGLHQPNSCSLHWTWSQLHRRTPPTKQLQPPLDLVTATQEDSTNQIGYSLHWTWSQLHRRTPPTKQLQPPLDLVTVAQEDSTNQTAAASTGLGHSCTGGLHQPNSCSLHWTWSQLHRRTPPTKQLQPPLDLVTAAQEDSTNQTATASTGLGHSCTGGLHQPNSCSLHWTWSQLHRRTPPTKQLQPPLDLVTVAQEDSTNQTATASTGLGHSCTGGLHQPNSCSLHWTWSQLHRRTPPTKQLQPPLDLVTAAQEDSTNQTATASIALCKLPKVREVHKLNSRIERTLPNSNPDKNRQYNIISTLV